MNKNTEISPFDLGRFTDQNTYDHVLEFHAKTNYTFLPGSDHRCYLSVAAEDDLSEIEQSELSIWPSMKPSVNLTSERNSFIRDESGEFFNDLDAVDFSMIDQLLTNSFCRRNNASRKRPYPSGGALYPIEVFLCKVSNNINTWPVSENILHLLPLRKQMESISTDSPETILKNLSGFNSGILGQPHFALVYAIFFERAIFKYRSRGYRLALMEAGSMYHNADINGKELGLRSRVWAGFTDYQVARTLGLDMKHIAPLAIQFFGYTGK